VRDFERCRHEERCRRRQEAAEAREAETKEFLKQHQTWKEMEAKEAKAEDLVEAEVAKKACQGHLDRVEEALEVKKKTQKEHVAFWDKQRAELQQKNNEVAA